MMAKLLLLSDIFSKTQATQALAKSLDATLLCANDTALPATQQHQAYQQFIAKGGHDEYLRRVMQTLERFRQVDVIGFSAGASAAWRAISQCRSAAWAAPRGGISWCARAPSAVRPRGRQGLAWPPPAR